MLHGVFKQNQIHHCIDLIVGIQRFFQRLAEAFPRRNAEVLGLSDSAGKVAVDERHCFQSFIVDVLKEEASLQQSPQKHAANVLQELMTYVEELLGYVKFHLFERLHVFLVHQFVAIDPACLVQP